MRRAALATLIGLAACGRGSSSTRAPGPTSAVAPEAVDPAPAGPDDDVVARVDGHPIYASCVQAQAAAHHLDVKAALDQCVAFELLAQEAERRDLRADLDVADAWRRELVRGVIQADLGKLTSFEQLPPAFLESVRFDEQQRPFLQRPEMRAAYYVRAELSLKEPIGSPADLEAKALADAIYAAIDGRDDITAPELFEIGERVAKERGDPPPTHESKPKITPKEHGVVKAAVKEFRDALYELPAVGTVHAPVRTKFGWDVILWHDTIPAADLTEQIFTGDLRRYFVPWSEGIARGLGITVWKDEALMETLAEPEDTAAQAEPAPAPESP